MNKLSKNSLVMSEKAFQTTNGLHTSLSKIQYVISKWEITHMSKWPILYLQSEWSLKCCITPLAK